MVVKPRCFYCQPKSLQSLMRDMKRGFYTPCTVLPTSTQNTAPMTKRQSQDDHSWSFASKYVSVWDGTLIKWTSSSPVHHSPLTEAFHRNTGGREQSRAQEQSRAFVEPEEIGEGAVHPVYLHPLAAICWSEVAQTHQVCDAIPTP